MRKRILSGLIAMAMIFSLLPQTISFAENDDSEQFSLFSISNVTYQAQFCACYSGGGHRVGQCNVASMVNLLRRKAAYLGVDAYFSPNSVYTALGINDAQQTRCSKDGRVGYIYSNYVSGNTSTARTYVDEYNVLKCTTANHSATTLSEFKSLLDQHPEGIFIGYSYPSSFTYSGYHRVIITRYEGNQLYAVDPVYASRGEIRVESIYGYRSDLISNHYEIMTIDSTNVPEKPVEVDPPHVHSWQTGYDSKHPHKQYRYCSDGDATEYTGKSRKVTSCKQCYPLGTTKLTRSFNKVEGTAIFKRNDVKNATEYTLTLNKDGSLYKTYKMTATKLSVTGLPVGKYTAKLTFKNGNTGETKTASTDSFKIVNTYTISYNANGGSGAPSSQTKIQGENLTLSSSVPKKTGHIFKGWASTNKAKNSQYAAGGTYKKNAKITLYAVWEPETYTIKFDANGGKGDLTDTTLTYGNTMRMPNSVVKEGFYLKGWSTNKNATNPDYRANMDYKLTANTTLYAVWGSSTWGGAVATEFAGGDGTAENPYQISNAGELAHLAYIVNSQTSTPDYKYYVLTDNISLGYEEWVPIGVYDNENQYFKGSFDGSKYTISDISMSQPNSGYIGIFGYTKDSEIKNITVTGDIVGISSSNYFLIGAIAGFSSNLKANNCNGAYVNISDIANTGTSYPKVGSLFGYATNNSNISNCKVNECYISAKSGNYDLGTIVGRVDGTITNCEVKSSGELLGTTSDSGAFSAGGLTGALAGTMKECKVEAGFLSNNIKSSNRVYLGGIIGLTDTGSNVELCSVKFNDGLSRTIDNGTYNASMIATTTGTERVCSGGIVGYVKRNTKIKDCIYNGESISSNGGDAIAGGIIGLSEGATTSAIAAQGGTPLNRDLLPTRNGYKATWYTDSAFKNEYDFTQNVTADTTLYAKWEKGEEEQPEIWDGTTKQPSYNASTKTYTVTNGAELAWIAALVNGELALDLPVDSTMEGYTVELVNDIYLNDISDWESWSDANEPANRWKPIGNDSNHFKGTFNGNNHAVKGIYTNGGSYQGLFGDLYGGTVKNLCVEDSCIIGTSTIGGIVGSCWEGTVSNCYNTGSVAGTTDNVGGVVGFVQTGTISNCYNTGSVSGGRYYVGGVVGRCYEATVSDCYNIGPVSGTADGVGGVLGQNHTGTISYCYNIGSVSGKSNIGGVVGSVKSFMSPATVKYCYATQSTLYNKGNDNATITSVTQKTAAQMKTLSNLSGFSTSTWANDTNNTNNGYPYLTALKKYNITVVEDIDAIPINRVFANVNGIIHSQTTKYAETGGIIGHVGSNGSEVAPAKNMLAIADRVSAVTSGSTYHAKVGDVVGQVENDGYDFSDTYSYASMDLSAVNSANTSSAFISNISSSRTLAQIKRAAFLKQVFGEPYQSLAYLEDHPNAVWVQKDGELPELYFNVLNDITVSDTENGTIAVDRVQAVNDEIVNVTASPAEGYELNKVYVNGKEIDGTTFAVDGDSDVFATFIEKTPEFSVEIEADANATATLTNVDEADVQLSSVGEFTLFADEPVTELTASDGEEIKVTTAADEDYTVDAIYVNGEEIAGDSFILTDDTKVTLEVTSLSTDTKAVTNDADNVGSYFAMLSGSVEGDTEGVSRYIRYWEKDNPDEVFTTEVEDGAGEYSATIDDLLPLTIYQYQMTEYGEVKEFTTVADEDLQFEDNSGDEPIDPTTEPSAGPTMEPAAEPTEEPIKREICFEIQNQLKDESSVSADVVNTTGEAQSGLVIYVAYDGTGALVKVETETITDLAANSTFPVEFAIVDGAEKYKILVWDSWKSMLPIAASVDIE